MGGPGDPRDSSSDPRSPLPDTTDSRPPRVGDDDGNGATALDAPVRVLVADDEEDIRLLVSLAVRRAGRTVVAAAADGAEALTAARAQHPELVGLDASMPAAAGLEVCAELRADPATAGCGVLLLSAGASPEDIARGLAAGADAYLPKPFTVAGLVDQVRRLTAGGPA